MDRNFKVVVIFAQNPPSLSARRAWIEISDLKGNFITNELSLSARRAWIEINNVETAAKASLWVALRKESVDRNAGNCSVAACPFWSLSARRAWIEMFVTDWAKMI